MKITLSDGYHINVRIFGDLKNNIIVFANGSVFNFKQFYPQIFPNIRKLLSSSWSYVFYDYVGFGGSSDLKADPDFEAYAKQHKELLDHLNIEKAHFFGYSKGSAISFLAADRALSIGSLGSPNFLYNYEGSEDFGKRKKRLEEIKDLWESRISRDNYKEVFGKIFIPVIFEGRENAELGITERVRSWYIRNKLKPMLYGTKIKSIVKLYSMYAEPISATTKDEFRKAISSVEIPVLLLHSTKDTTTPIEGARQLHQMISSSKLMEFENMTHTSTALVRSHAKEIALAYTKFLRGI